MCLMRKKIRAGKVNAACRSRCLQNTELANSRIITDDLPVVHGFALSTIFIQMLCLQALRYFPRPLVMLRVTESQKFGVQSPKHGEYESD